MTWCGLAIVHGEAQGMGSKRAFNHRATGRVVVVDDKPAALRSWQREMRDAMRECAPPEPLDCAVAVSVTIYVLRPLAHYRVNKSGRFLREDAPRFPPTGRDVDKVLRASLDVGTGTWWRDDSRVADARIRRRYTESEPRTEIRARVPWEPLAAPLGQMGLEVG